MKKYKGPMKLVPCVGCAKVCEVRSSRVTAGCVQLVKKKDVDA